jgi:hypothetical protein
MSEDEFLTAVETGLRSVTCGWDQPFRGNPTMVLSNGSKTLGIEFSRWLIEGSTSESVQPLINALDFAFTTGDATDLDSHQMSSRGVTVWSIQGFLGEDKGRL